MKNAGLHPGAGSPAALGDILDTIVPIADPRGKGKPRIGGAFHQAVYDLLGKSPHPMTPWDIRQALKRAGWGTIDRGGALSLALSDGMAAGIVQFGAEGYHLRKGGRR